MTLGAASVFRQNCAHPDIQNVQLQPDVGLVLGEDLDAVDVAEVGQEGHQVGPGVDDVTDAVTGAHEQRHLGLLLPLLQKAVRMHNRVKSTKKTLLFKK